MAALHWQTAIEDLAELFPFENPVHTELSLTLRKFHIAWIFECRMLETVVRSSSTAEVDVRVVTKLWDDCEFMLGYLMVVHDQNHLISIVATLLQSVVPRHQETEKSIVKIAKNLHQLSGRLRDQDELSHLIKMASQSLDLYFLRRKRIARLMENVKHQTQPAF